jgi:hypothetical protein
MRMDSDEMGAFVPGLAADVRRDAQVAPWQSVSAAVVAAV